MAALTFVIPLSAGVFDISIPTTMSLAGVMSTYAIVNSGQSVFVGILIALGACLLVGILNGIVVVVLQIESLIGTLATSFLIQAVIVWRTGSRNISGPQLAGGFQDIAQTSWLFDLTLPVYYALVLAFVLWYVLEHTATGRRIYATGFNLDATRLASVRTERIRFGSLIAAAFLAGITGIVLASNIGSGSSTAGGELPAPGDRRGVPRGDPAEERTLQRLGHDHRRRAPRHAGDRTRAGRSRSVGAAVRHRRRVDRRPCSDRIPGAARRVRGPQGPRRQPCCAGRPGSTGRRTDLSPSVLDHLPHQLVVVGDLELA